MHVKHNDYVKELRKKWKPLLETAQVSVLGERHKDCLSVLLENIERYLEESDDNRKIRSIFIPLTVKVFLELASEMLDLTAMRGPVDLAEGGGPVAARTRKLENFKAELPEGLTGLDADSRLVEAMCHHICSQLFKEIAKSEKGFYPYILVYPRGGDVTVLYTRYGTL